MHSQAVNTPTLDANLTALSRLCPRLVERLRQTDPRADIEFVETPDGVPSAIMTEPSGAARTLASKRRPLDEAKRLTEAFDPVAKGLAVVVGFGLGYHVASVARKMKRAGLIIVFEPDLALLRAVFERVDCSEWLEASNITILTDPKDQAAISKAVEGNEGIASIGVEVIDHPPSQWRLGADAKQFHKSVNDVLKAMRTIVVTTLVQARTTLRNLTANADHYARFPGVADLKNSAASRPAIVVSAGPSLARTIDQLAQPDIRERVVIIAAQTVLKPLIERGIRPHYITALDYHEISHRFYDSLTPADVEGVTLIAEPKVNPAVLEAFPGNIRCVGSKYLDQLLGEELSHVADGPDNAIHPGATVAHLSYYLARHLGCDPVILTGQDLGFTDHQYYAAGATIHDVWACELSDFMTLEMFEWQRIKRMGRYLRRRSDVEGRTIYTDEQMSTYLVQFERDFAADADQGLTTIDATEGGVAKGSTTPMAMSAALAKFADDNAAPINTPATPHNPPSTRRIAECLRSVRAGVFTIGENARRVRLILVEMSEHQKDQERVNRLHTKVHELAKQTTAIKPAYELVDYLNQIGAFNRVKADRARHLAEGLDKFEIQARELERDIHNAEWLASSADELGAMLDDALATLERGAPRRTRDPGVRSGGAEDTLSDAEAAETHKTRTIRAVICLDPDHSSIGLARPAETPLALGKPALRLTLERLSRAKRLDGVVIVTPDKALAERLIGTPIPGLDVEIVHTDRAPLSPRRDALRVARLASRASFRSGLAGAACFDEAHDPDLTAHVLETTDTDAALIVGADWALVDPELCDEIIERHLEAPDTLRLVYSQAPPGLGGCILARSLAREIADSPARRGPLSTIGALLSYLPSAPTPDSIANPPCVQVDARLRSCNARFIPDPGPGEQLVGGIINHLRERFARATGQEILDTLREIAPTSEAPERLTIELTTRRGATPPWMRPRSAASEPVDLDPDLARNAIDQLAEARPDAELTFAGRGDPLLHDALPELIEHAREAGIPFVHVRTSLDADAERVQRLAEASPHVVSVDLWADKAETYEELTDSDAFERVRDNLDLLSAARTMHDGMPLPFIVPRITRCDAVYEQIEHLYDRAIMSFGWGVIDPAPEGERLPTLPRPESARRRVWDRSMTLRADGTIPIAEAATDQTPAHARFDQTSLTESWHSLIEARQSADDPSDPSRDVGA